MDRLKGWFVNSRLKRVLSIVVASLTAMLMLGVVTPAFLSGSVYADSPPDSTAERPFQLPFTGPPGPDTWLMAQPYGNTTGAYFQRNTTYGASGGIHFGVDLAAPCGTEVAAIADGVVFAVDGPFGSPPHNLMIDHPQLGYASMYGHLLEAPDWRPGQQVKQGEVVALVGDSAGFCYRRPHLHLEIRDLDHVRKFNPQTLIQADWDDLTLTGSGGRSFMKDLAEPRKWQSLYDQPEVRTGGPIVNDFDSTWPLDWHRRSTNPVTPAGLVQSTSIQTQTVDLVPLRSSAIGRQITRGTCCTLPYWNQDSTEIRFVDQPSAAEPVGIWGVDVTEPQPTPKLITERLGVYSRDGGLIAYPDWATGLAIVERPADGQQWTIDTQERPVNFRPDSQGLLWLAYDEDAPWDNRDESIWLADVDGSNARKVFSARRTNPIAWLSNDEVLMARRQPGSSDVELFTLSLEDGAQTGLIEGPRMRGISPKPGKAICDLLRYL